MAISSEVDTVKRAARVEKFRDVLAHDLLRLVRDKLTDEVGIVIDDKNGRGV